MTQRLFGSIRTYLRHVGEVQGDIVLALTYVIVVLPVWAVLRLSGRALLEPDHQGWRRRDAGDPIDVRQPY